MRISDWSSDVCSSDLGAGDVVQDQAHVRLRGAEGFHDLRQQVEDGRAARGHVQLAGVQAAQLLAEHAAQRVDPLHQRPRSEEHTSELQSLMRLSYAVFCLKKKKKPSHHHLIEQNKTQIKQ